MKATLIFQLAGYWWCLAVLLLFVRDLPVSIWAHRKPRLLKEVLIEPKGAVVIHSGKVTQLPKSLEAPLDAK